MQLVIAFITASVVFLAIDAVWLGVIAKDLYRRNLGALLADQPNFVAAAAFYVIFIFGLTALAIAPALRDGAWTSALWRGAVFGLAAYATYDLTNLATLRGWPGALSVIDIAWGTTLSATTALCAYIAARALSSG